jgi:membrane protease YdiL (CAAX protease family)
MPTPTEPRPTRLPAADRRRLIAFVVLAFGWTWALWIPGLVRSAATGLPLPTLDPGFAAWRGLSGVDAVFAVAFQLAVYGPALAALVVLVREPRPALGAWARSLVRFDVAPRWYAFVFGAPIALALALVALAVLTGSGTPTWSAVPAWPLLLGWFAGQVATSGLEEPGWRGFALPLLQRTYTAERANWLLGFVWAAWHLPFVLYLYRDLPIAMIPLTLGGFAMSIVAMGFVHAWVANSTGSVALNVLLHAWANVATGLVALVVVSPIVPLATAGFTWLFVAWLLRRFGGATLQVPATVPSRP